MSTLRSVSCRLAPLIAMILVGCGQKGPLTLPKPQFPAPAAANASGPPPSNNPPANEPAHPVKK
ncbi:MAG: hypothetical protein EBR85_04890 [Betaproteobacteria bacterium]|nr:hypothetical protein [Betaproteobacteria bacterium]